MKRGKSRHSQPVHAPRLMDDTLIFLESPREEKHARRGLLSRREVVVVAALLAVIVGTAGVVTFRSHSTPASTSLPILNTIPTFPQFGGTHTATRAPTRSATRPANPAHISPAVQTPTPAQTMPATQQASPGVFVTYQVTQQWDGGFEAEVSVVNDEPTSISGWEIAVDLPDDTVTSFWNATGFFNNGILLLYQPSDDGPIPADGGTLRVFFMADGRETTPTDCAFDSYICTIDS